MGFAPKKNTPPFTSSLSLPLHFSTSLNPQRVSDLNFLPPFPVPFPPSIFGSFDRFPLVFHPSVMADSHTPSSISPPPLTDRRQSLMPPSAADSTRFNSQSDSSSITVDGSNRFWHFNHSLQLDAVNSDSLFLGSLVFFFLVFFPRYERVFCGLYFVFLFCPLLNVSLGDFVTYFLASRNLYV